MATEEHFWRRVDKQGVGGCWLWTGSCFSNGYGYFQVSWRPRVVTTAHRFAYEHVVGPVPAGLDLDHLCRVRNCVNPDHLEPVTRSENLRRSPGLMGRHNREKTHCKRGHPYDEENTYRYRTGRHCRRCRVMSNRRARRREQRRVAELTT